MKQLHIRDPWASMGGQDSNRELLHDLSARLRVLEDRIRQLEQLVSERTERETVGVAG